MRMKGHAEHDDFRYVPADLLEKWKRKDPIDRFTGKLRERKVLTGEREDEITRRVAGTLDEAVRFAEESPLPEPAEAAQDVYAESD
ncbi:MAG: thiamine pyrophosphate-dependent enzyme, partial [Acidobacteria bacterium]|nr:thiamine pyrophosphate-dependent enzyme [Acidobacteriota bacterium]